MKRSTRTRNRLTGLVAIGLTLSLAAVGCAGRNDRSSTGAATTGLSSATGADTFTIDTSQCGSYNASQGIDDATIKLGSSFPQSGLYGAYAEISKGYLAYFDYINGQGGVRGKTIEVVTKDDQYDPSKTKQNAQELVLSDGVFALFNVVGTPNNLAIRDDLASQCVPDLFAASGSVLWGQTADYPWLIGSIPSYATESAVWAQWLKTNKPNAEVAILGQNDDVGAGYADAFRRAISGTDISVVAEQTYNPADPDVKSQVTTLAASGADTFLVAAAALKCPQALNAAQEAGWKPTTYISGTCTPRTIIGLANSGAADGVFSTISLKDPVDPEWASDEGMQQFKELGKEHGLTDADLTDSIVAYGWAIGQLLVETLMRSPELTRQSVMETAYSLRDLGGPLLLPGITINTNGTTDPFPIEQLQIGQYNGRYWQLQGAVISLEGKTGEYIGG